MLAKVRGSLYYAVLFVSVIFAAATGIVGASVTILGIMAAKSMKRSKYNVRLAAGTITAGGTLGILIPPSIMLVVMGPIMEIPVIDLFAAAILPGILLASLYAAYTKAAGGTKPKKNSSQSFFKSVVLNSSGMGGPSFGFKKHLSVV